VTLSISGGEGLLDASVAGEAGEVAGAHERLGEQAEFAFDEVIREEPDSCRLPPRRGCWLRR
jgi:hypothetical protein